jgi:hypothetical protein
MFSSILGLFRRVMLVVLFAMHPAFPFGKAYGEIRHVSLALVYPLRYRIYRLRFYPAI